MNPRDLINDMIALDTVIKLLGKGEFELAHHKVKDVLEAKKEALRDIGLRPESFKKRKGVK